LSARTIAIAGAGIGGLTAALALATRGFRVALFDKAARLEETGAGIQLSPNATRVLNALGLRDRLMASVVAPDAVIIKTAQNAELARLPLGPAAEKRYGAPYWMIHRGDLQAALLGSALAHPGITLTLAAGVDDCAVSPGGVTLQVLRGETVEEIDAAALIGADGLWSRVRAIAGEADAARFARRTAWRALVLADAVPPAFRAPAIHLWLGHGSHLVHYAVKGGAMINIVAIAGDAQPSHGWSTAAAPDEVLARFSSESWARPARDLMALPERWLKWPLYDRPPRPQRGRGAVTLLGDAAHPMLPFLAQGAAMAIEDAAVLAGALAAVPDDAPAALRRYEQARAARTARVWRAARRNDTVYHLPWPASAARNFAMGRMGSERLLAHYDWIYGWRPE
jgi:2-polyprenyl-6-methoxyphenol hydroxylase-like FAD-dependent oxidoreductase